MTPSVDGTGLGLLNRHAITIILVDCRHRDNILVYLFPIPTVPKWTRTVYTGELVGPSLALKPPPPLVPSWTLPSPVYCYLSRICSPTYLARTGSWTTDIYLHPRHGVSSLLHPTFQLMPYPSLVGQPLNCRALPGFLGSGQLDSCPWFPVVITLGMSLQHRDPHFTGTWAWTFFGWLVLPHTLPPCPSPPASPLWCDHPTPQHYTPTPPHSSMVWLVPSFPCPPAVPQMGVGWETARQQHCS